MATRKLVSKHVNVASGDYIGRVGELWVDTVTNTMKISDGTTPGGATLTTDGGAGAVTWAAITNINNINGPDNIAVGNSAGFTNQGTYGIALGFGAGDENQGIAAISIGYTAGVLNQSEGAVAVGYQAGNTTQGTKAVAIGVEAGQTTQGTSAVAIGDQAGRTTQGTLAVALGNSAGETDQATNSVAVGNLAGQTTQGDYAVAVGPYAGNITQGGSAVAVGYQAGKTTQGASAIAIGKEAGYTNQAARSIVINASGAALENTVEDTFVVKPIRNATMTTILGYDVTTGEVTHNAAIPYPANAGVSWDGEVPTTVDGALDRLALYTQDFAVSTDAHWADPDPADITDAINRLAAAIYALNGNTGI